MGIAESMREKIGLSCVLSTGERVRIVDALNCYEGDFFFVELLEGPQRGLKKRIGSFDAQLLFGSFIDPTDQ